MRLRLWTAIALFSALLVAWAGVAIFVSGGVRMLAAQDDLSFLRAQWHEAEQARFGTEGRRVAMYLADSSCCTRSPTDPAAGAPELGAALGDRLAGASGALGPGWAYRRICWGGADGVDFEALAGRLAGFKPPPALALLAVNLRSLNRLGTNWFPVVQPDQADKAAGASATLPSPPRLEAPVPADPFLRLSLPASVLRGLAVWTRQGLLAALTPKASLALRDQGRETWVVVYGEGYDPSPAALGALLNAGLVLRAHGCRVLYYLVPVDRRGLAQALGPGPLQQVDAGAATVLAALRGQGFQALDLHAFADGGFYEPPTEHLDWPARKRVADALTRWVLGQAGRVGP